MNTFTTYSNLWSSSAIRDGVAIFDQFENRFRIARLDACEHYDRHTGTLFLTCYIPA
jgi:hypothetical protein